MVFPLGGTRSKAKLYVLELVADPMPLAAGCPITTVKKPGEVPRGTASWGFILAGADALGCAVKPKADWGVGRGPGGPPYVASGAGLLQYGSLILPGLSF
jgi:hypothetical protein